MLKKIKELLLEYNDFIAVLAASVCLELITRHFIRLGFGMFTLLFDLLYLAMLFLLILFIPRRGRHIIETLIITVFSFYCFAQSLHYAYFSSLFTFRKLTLAGDLKDVFSEIFVKLNYTYLAFLIPVVIIVVWSIIRSRLIKKVSVETSTKLIISLLIVLFLGAGLFTISREMKRSDIEDDWMGDLYLYDTFYNNLRFYDRFGLYEYVAKDTRLSIEQNQSTSLSEEERERIDSFISNHQNKEQNDHTGIYSGKNLVLILCESLNDYPLYKDLFPTLNMMAVNGTLFTNYYAPLYQSSTSDSEFISLTSMLPSVDFGTTSYSFANNQYPYALPNLFKDAGYNVNSYHSNISNMYNREPLHMSLGFETFYDQEKLGLSTEGRYFQMWVNWIDDDELFDATIRNTHTNKPFFDFVITASGHLPYIRDREEIQIQLDELEKTEYAQLDEETKCYLASQMNFDKGLAQLLDSLKAADQLENTIIILYGDHYPYGLSTEEALNNVVGESDYNKNRVPFIIYDPSAKGSANANLASTFDIYPTICNLFGLDTGDSYQVGRDLFGSRPGIIPFMDRSVLTDTFYYDSTSNSFTEFEGFSKESATEIINDIQDVFDIGQKILSVNYYANEK